MESPKFKVLVRCFTYNQSKYITDALNGFTMQQTSFPFVCTIVDDASTDGEQEVIRKYVEDNFDFSEGSVAYHKETDYAHITYAQHQTNKNCYFAVLYLKENHYSQRKPKMQYLEEWRGMCEYEAICEGDDYWIAADKLEKQVEKMDENLSITLSFTNVEDKVEDKSLLAKSISCKYQNDKLPDNKKDLFYYILLGKCRIQTLTTLFRLNSLKIIKPNKKAFMMGDTTLWLDLSQQGSFLYMPDVTGVYRRHEGSACRNPDTFKQFRLSMYEMRIYYCNKYGYEIPSIIRKFYCESVVDCIYSGIKIDLDNNIYINSINPLQKYLLQKSINSYSLRLLIKFIWKIEHKFRK